MQLSPDDIGALDRQLAQADASRADLLAEALWSEVMDVEHARLRAAVSVGTTDDDEYMRERQWRSSHAERATGRVDGDLCVYGRSVTFGGILWRLQCQPWRRVHAQLAPWLHEWRVG